LAQELKTKGQRRYADIWERLKETKRCEIRCDPDAVNTIVAMVRKEKLQDKTKQKGMLVKHSATTDVVGDKAVTTILFTLVVDTSIRNL